MVSLDSQVVRLLSRNWNTKWLVVGAFLVGLLVALLPLVKSTALLVGVAFFILILIQPLVGIALVLLAGPLGAVESIWFGNPLIKSSQFLLLITVCAWLAYSIWRRRINIPRSPIILPLLIFLSVGILSLIDAPSLRLGAKELIKWLELGLLMLIVTDLTLYWRSTDKDIGSLSTNKGLRGIDVRWLVAILLIAGLSQALLGIWQFGLRGTGPDHFLILDRFYRAFGTFQQPNPFGAFMGMTAGLAIGTTAGMAMGLIDSHRAKRRLKRQDLLWLMFFASCAIIAGLALIMSWSRGAWIGFALAMIVLTLFLPRKLWSGVILLVIGFAFLLLAIRFNLIPPSINDRLSNLSQDLIVSDVRGVHVTEQNFSVIERLAHWQAGLAMARDNLLLGVGFGNYEAAYEDYGLINWTHPLGHAHNYYINILAETGIIGIIAYLILWTFILVQLLILIKRLDWPDRGIALGLLVAWSALSVHHLFDKLYVNNLFLFMGVMLGLQQVLALKDDKVDR